LYETQQEETIARKLNGTIGRVMQQILSFLNLTQGKNAIPISKSGEASSSGQLPLLPGTEAQSYLL
jgi:hypothetical protein